MWWYGRLRWPACYGWPKQRNALVRITDDASHRKKCPAKSVFRLEANLKAAQSPSCCKKVLSLGKYRSCAQLFATFQGLQWPQSALGICKIVSGAKRWSLIKGKLTPPPKLTSTNAMKN